MSLLMVIKIAGIFLLPLTLSKPIIELRELEKKEKFDDLFYRFNLPTNYTFTIYNDITKDSQKRWVMLNEMFHEISEDQIQLLKSNQYKLAFKTITWDQRKRFPHTQSFAQLVQEETRRFHLFATHSRKRHWEFWHRYSHASDREDIWLFKHAFFNVRRGLILESGALDGYFTSTSYMFEHYADWRTIHIGR